MVNSKHLEVTGDALEARGQRWKTSNEFKTKMQLMALDSEQLSQAREFPPWRTEMFPSLQGQLLDPTGEWDHAVFVFLCVVNFTHHNDLPVCPCCKCQNHTFFRSYLHSIVPTYPTFCMYLSTGGHSGCLCILGAVNSAAITQGFGNIFNLLISFPLSTH